MEIRFVLRRKKEFPEDDIEELLDDFQDYFIVEVPDSLDIIRADKLQTDLKMDPFDAIYLSLTELTKPDVLITRDAGLQDAVNEREGLDMGVMEPEPFLEQYFPDIFEELKDDLDTDRSPP